MDPDNFRGITLISCLRKLFTSIIISRLTFFANEISLISKNQAGFRKGHSTIDNLFVLHSLISLYQSFEKKIISYIRRFPQGIRHCLKKWSVENITE